VQQKELEEVLAFHFYRGFPSTIPLLSAKAGDVLGEATRRMSWGEPRRMFEQLTGVTSQETEVREVFTSR